MGLHRSRPKESWVIAARSSSLSVISFNVMELSLSKLKSKSLRFILSDSRLHHRVGLRREGRVVGGGVGGGVHVGHLEEHEHDHRAKQGQERGEVGAGTLLEHRQR